MNAYFPYFCAVICALCCALLVVLLVLRQFEQTGKELDEDR